MRYRFDGFTPGKQRRFLDEIERGGCLADACYAAHISKTTVGRWRKKEPGFEEELQRRRAIAGGALERIAWERAVHGAPETVTRNGELVQVRVKPSDAMLRLLLQACNPDKYGAVGGGPGRRGGGHGIRPRVATNEEVRKALVKRLTAFGVRVTAEEANRASADGEAAADAR